MSITPHIMLRVMQNRLDSPRIRAILAFGYQR